MAKFGFDEVEDNVLAPHEPQVTSSDPDVRKAARNLRIKRRQEAIKKAEQPPEEAAAEEEPGLIEQATTNAAVELQRLALDGAAKVTNVKVTTDDREVMRRNLFSDKMARSVQKIEDEAMEAQIQYEAITENWEAMLAIKDPLDIDAEMKEQKKRCDELLESKNKLIAELKNDLKQMDRDYYDDLDKQDKDIKELSDRVEKQVTIMQRAYEKQLTLIDHAINMEREAMIAHNNKRWEALYKQRDKEEVAHMEYAFEQLDEFKLGIDEIMWDHHEKYREAKIELETLLQDLQRELEKLKATCIINTEKIGYNYQILKKREEENVFVRSQQKRKINKMSDVANSLRVKIRKAAEDGAVEEQKSDVEIVKLLQAMSDLEKKSNHFSHTNHYKFSQVWRMAAAKCSELVRDLRQGEVAIHAHILSESPPPPPPPPPKSPLSKYEREFQSELPKKKVKLTEMVDPNNDLARSAKERLIRHILQLVADNTGFLVEDRLLRLIEKYQSTSRNLCTLDAIFMALEIEAEEDIDLLCQTFLKYAFCPICIGLEAVSESSSTTGGDSHPHTLMAKSSRGDHVSLRPHPSLVRSISASTRSAHIGFRSHELSPEDQLLVNEAEEIIQKCGDPQTVTLITGTSEEAVTSRRTIRGVVTLSSQHDVTHVEKEPGIPFLCPVGHHLEIEPMQVLTALGEFISVFVPPEKKKLNDILDSVKPPDFSSPSRKLTPEEIEQYWSQWKNFFTLEKDKFWDGLLTGLNNYLPILQERERLHDEVVHLRRRNAALRRLVRGALPDLPQASSLPQYARRYPDKFTCTFSDVAPLPRISNK